MEKHWIHLTPNLPYRRLPDDQTPNEGVPIIMKTGTKGKLVTK